ncbi:hypothetical protein EGT67_13185 [Prescottella agglutinans]|uniref:Uncharacterized protein n=1 Tax=Prescottella agglutinans TaxID=1644129 RepID=A0A3S3BTT0_9NOCA|nr:hypothetical protein [Prescottella agglutinans]RVW09101.1 hypothetical protein EGT67_13185 [Prescottella agglutinans]
MTGKHFELTDEARNYLGRNLHRICATRDMPRYGVRRGDIGGWVEHERNLSGDARVSGHAEVYGRATITERQDILVHPIGSQPAAATLTRTADGHNISVGCWRGGTVDTLPAQVDRRSQTWPGTAGDHAR